MHVSFPAAHMGLCPVETSPPTAVSDSGPLWLEVFVPFRWTYWKEKFQSLAEAASTDKTSRIAAARAVEDMRLTEQIAKL